MLGVLVIGVLALAALWGILTILAALVQVAAQILKAITEPANRRRERT